MADDNIELRYQQMVANFTARKLPDFYRKYQTEATSSKFAADALHDDVELFPRPLPMEKLLRIPAQVRKRRFFEAISVGDIVEGRVDDKWADTLFIKVDSVLYGPNRWISDLKIKAECNLSEFKTHSGSRRLSDSITDFDIGDNVRGVVSSVDQKNWKLTVSFRRSSLPDYLSHTELGAVEFSRSNKMPVDDAADASYIEHLVSTPSFANPEATNNLLRHLGIDTKQPATFLKSLSHAVPIEETGEKLRERQSTQWSLEMVANGVKLFKEGKHNEALKCFDQALQMHTTNVEALVARGALRANQGMLKSAIVDFRKALEIHPSHRNGLKYLCETLLSLAKQYEKDRDWKEATGRYKEVLELDAEHQEARERIHQIRLLVTQQVLAGKRHAPFEATSKSKDATGSSKLEGRPESLISLLRKKVPKKHKKLKKAKKLKSRKRGKKKARRERSSTDSSDSESDDSEVTASASEKPSSDSDSEWVERDLDTSTSSLGSASLKAPTGEQRQARDIKSKHEESMSKGTRHDRRKSHDDQRRLSSEGHSYGALNSSGALRRHSEEPVSSKTASKQPVSSKTASKQQREQTSSRHGCTATATQDRDFSADERNFISSILSKKPNKL